MALTVLRNQIKTMGKRFLAKSLIHLRPMIWSYRNQSTDFHSKSIDGNIACKCDKLTDGTFRQKNFQNKIKFLNIWKLHVFFKVNVYSRKTVSKIYLH